MPKLKISDTEHADRAVRAIIERQLIMLGFGKDYLPKVLGVNPATWWRRNQTPERLTLLELRALVARLHLTDKDLCAMVGVPYNGTGSRGGL